MTKILVGSQRRYKLFLGEPGSNTHDVDHVALHHTHVHEVTTTEGIKFLPFAFTLFLLLSKALVIFLWDWLELYGIVGVLPTASGTTPIEVLLDVVPAETADLVSTNTRFKIKVRDVHLLQTEGAFSVICIVVAPVRVLDTSQNVGL